jgi:hypothetical protein
LIANFFNQNQYNAKIKALDDAEDKKKAALAKTHSLSAIKRYNLRRQLLTVHLV